MENAMIRRITKLITGWQKIAKHRVIAVVSIKYFFIRPGKSVSQFFKRSAKLRKNNSKI
jgi:hypothetical protein